MDEIIVESDSENDSDNNLDIDDISVEAFFQGILFEWLLINYYYSQ
jgi:hypothetical protein